MESLEEYREGDRVDIIGGLMTGRQATVIATADDACMSGNRSVYVRIDGDEEFCCYKDARLIIKAAGDKL